MSRLADFRALFPNAEIITIGDYDAIPNPASIKLMAGGVDITEQVLTSLIASVRAMPGYPSKCQGHPALLRVREIGQGIHDIGGLPLMQAVFYRVARRLGGEGKSILEWAWHEVGEWRV